MKAGLLMLVFGVSVAHAVPIDVLRDNTIFWSRLGYNPDPCQFDSAGRQIVANSTTPVYAARHKALYDAGIKVHSSTLFSGWVGPNKYDYTETDKTLKALFDAVPEALYLPRVKLNAPAEWQKAYPEEVFVFLGETNDPQVVKNLIQTDKWDFNGEDMRGMVVCRDARGVITNRIYRTKISSQSFASARWAHDADEALRRLADHIKASPYRDRVIGFHIGWGACGETCHWGRGVRHYGDNSRVFRKAFRDWGAKGEVDPENPEFKRFVTHLNVTLANRFGATLKKGFGKDFIVGIFYGYILDCYNAAYSGWLGYDELLSSPNIDFWAGPCSYMRRTPGQPGGWFAPAMSINRSKLWVDELDVRTYLDKHPHNIHLRCDTPAGTREAMFREMCKNLMADSGFWWMDLGGGWYDTPEMTNIVKDIEVAAKRIRARKHVSTADVLVIVDDKILQNLPMVHYSHFLQMTTFRDMTMSGMLIDIYRADDCAALDLSQYKYKVCFHTPDERYPADVVQFDPSKQPMRDAHAWRAVFERAGCRAYADAPATVYGDNRFLGIFPRDQPEEFTIIYRDDFVPVARHVPRKVLGKDYWTLLMAWYFSDPTYLAQMDHKPDIMNVPELISLPLFRDCALSYRGDVQMPDPTKNGGKVTYRTLYDYYKTNGRWEQLASNAKPHAPFFMAMSGLRGAALLAGDIDLDLADYRRQIRRFPNFIGNSALDEWDNDPMLAWWRCTIWKDQKRVPAAHIPKVLEFLTPWPTNRHQRMALQKKYFDRMVDLHFKDRAHTSALRCCLAIDHNAAAWGAKVLELETTNTTTPPDEYRWDIQPMFTRGAARQFDVPWEWYVAQYVNGYRKDGTRMNNSAAGYFEGTKTTNAPNQGISRSLYRRVCYMAYLSGANFIQPEGWYSLLLDREPSTGRAMLSPHGRIFSDFHDFTRAHPDRGTPYAPVAVLVPFNQGYPATGGNPWGIAGDYKPADQTVDAVFFTIDPGYDREAVTRAGGEGNLHNTKYAMMYDVICPDAPQTRTERRAALGSYRAVIVTGEYENRAFEKELTEFAQNGGEVIRIKPEDLPPMTDAKQCVKDIKTGKRTFPTVAKTLDDLQARLFPFRVTGDCLYGANRTTCGWWVWCLNNAGVTKYPDLPQSIDDSAVAHVKVALGAVRAHRVRELLSGADVAVIDGAFEHTIPAGDLAIFEIEE